MDDMAANKERPHIIVLSEDPANHDFAKGFEEECSENPRAIQVLNKPSGGWLNVAREFENVHLKEMIRNANRYMVLLVDFDGHYARLATVQKHIPTELRDRVMVLGVWSDPEKAKMGASAKRQEVGSTLAKECRSRVFTIWKDDAFKHNLSEIARMGDTVRAILFSS